MNGIMRDNGSLNLGPFQTCLYTGLNRAKRGWESLPYSILVLHPLLWLSLDYPFQLSCLSWLQRVSTSRMLLNLWELCELKLDTTHMTQVRSVHGTLIYFSSCPLLWINMKFCPKCWYNVQQDGIAKLGYKWHICPKCGHHLARLDYSPSNVSG